MAYEGSCHCGTVAFNVEGDAPTEAITCNCSHCRRKGLLLAFVPADKFTLISGEDVLTSYLFNTHRIEHRFCSICGCEPFAEGKSPDGSATRAINLRCVPEVDLAGLKLNAFDGASH